MEENDINRLKNNKVFELINNIGNELTNSAQDAVKFIDGNNSAGTRIRKTMQSIKKLAQEVRVEVQTQKNEVSV